MDILQLNSINKKTKIIIIVLIIVFVILMLVSRFDRDGRSLGASPTTYTVTDASYTFTYGSDSCAGGYTNGTVSDGAQGTVYYATCVGRKDSVIFDLEKTLTWESMGVDAGDTIDTVDGSYVYRIASESNPGEIMSTGDLKIYAGATLCATLESGIDPTSSTFTTIDSSGAVAVDAACEASDTSIKIVVENATAGTGNSASADIDLRWDDVSLTIVSTPATPETAPTVVLNSPVDATSTTDTTPDLNFTGTDINSDDITYNLQLADNNFSSAVSFDGSSQYATLTTLGSLGSSMSGGFYTKFKIVSTSTTKGYFGTLNDGGSTGVQIIPNSDYTEAQSSGKIGFWIRSENGLAISGATTNDTGFNDGSVHEIEIYCDTSAQTIAISVDGSPESITYLQQNAPSTYANFGYAFAIGARNNRGSFDNYFAATIDDFVIGTSSSSLFGEYYFDEGSGTSVADSSGNGYDATLVNSPVWTDDLTPFLIDVVSDTDAGFSGTPDNTDPFTSGQDVTYTVQAADELSEGTYYWRVRGIDKSGSNTYGDWATSTSFIVSIAAVSETMYQSEFDWD